MQYYIRIINAYKAKLRRVFDYLTPESLLNPNDNQKEMLSTICDGVEKIEGLKFTEAQSKLKEGDYLYEVSWGGEMRLVTIYEPKKKKEEIK